VGDGLCRRWRQSPSPTQFLRTARGCFEHLLRELLNGLPFFAKAYAVAEKCGILAKEQQTLISSSYVGE